MAQNNKSFMNFFIDMKVFTINLRCFFLQFSLSTIVHKYICLHSGSGLC